MIDTMIKCIRCKQEFNRKMPSRVCRTCIKNRLKKTPYEETEVFKEMLKGSMETPEISAEDKLVNKVRYYSERGNANMRAAHYRKKL